MQLMHGHLSVIPSVAHSHSLIYQPEAFSRISCFHLINVHMRQHANCWPALHIMVYGYTSAKFLYHSVPVNYALVLNVLSRKYFHHMHTNCGMRCDTMDTPNRVIMTAIGADVCTNQDRIGVMESPDCLNRRNRNELMITWTLQLLTRVRNLHIHYNA